METIVDYKLAYNTNPMELERDVLHMIAAGYKPLGGPIQHIQPGTGNALVQLMVLTGEGGTVGAEAESATQAQPAEDEAIPGQETSKLTAALSARIAKCPFQEEQGETKMCRATKHYCFEHCPVQRRLRTAQAMFDMLAYALAELPANEGNEHVRDKITKLFDEARNSR